MMMRLDNQCADARESAAAGRVSADVRVAGSAGGDTEG
jgi:hypothetical protein